ncbi:hypothetical protein [Ulvibacterium marinum]|uniref:Uncharacterized protein n=1 Tax=Ulvibacterium marinum TaxID=2419782 RepID=A0A3B0C2T6_9FLAO|nr:hypothetical protein [Ulvibacterium marinum]RKN79792.1 hypothetical protein D7Z94_16055 [Ulvibacterium marinum]
MAQDRRLERVLQMMENRATITITKDTPEDLRNDIRRAKALGYIQKRINPRTGRPTNTYEYTEKGQRLVDSGYNFTVVDDSSSIRVEGTNIHVGTNYGVNNFTQQWNKNKKLSWWLTLIIMVVAGIIVFLIEKYLF